MCRKSGSLYVICAMAVALGILFGVILPAGFLVFVLCVLLIAVGIAMLF